MPTVAEPLIQYLRELEQRGQTHVNVDDDARKILREFFLRARAASVSSGSAGAVALKRESSAAPQTAAAPSSVAASVNISPADKGSSDGASSDGGTATPCASGATAAEKIDSLKRQVAKWPALLKLKGLRSTMVFSAGNAEADIMLVGEAPGYDEERLGEPFVGKAGQKLDGILKAMGAERKSVYISNIVKFRPAMPSQTTNNRKPTREELDACMPFIREEVKVVAPKVIIVLGAAAAQELLKTEDDLVSMRGKFHDYAGVPVRVTYHPSYILHNEATSEKRKIWEDMLAVMDLLKMPVSDKQRGYFL